MPAYRERIFICPRENGQPVWILDFPMWWDRRAFFEKYGDRRIDTGNPFYVDYGLLLTGSEAGAWDKLSRETLADNPPNWHAHMRATMRRLESILATASWVIVESYEWESGLE